MKKYLILAGSLFILAGIGFGLDTYLLAHNYNLAAHVTGAIHSHAHEETVDQALVNEIQSLNSEIRGTRPTGSVGISNLSAPPNVQRLIAITQKRRNVMKKLAKDNPKAFLQNVLPASTRSSLPTETHQYLEKNAILSGKTEVTHVDDFNNHANSKFEYVINTGQQKINLYPTKDIAVSSGAIIQAQGYQIEDTLVANTDTNTNAVQVTQAAPAPEALGNQRTLFLLVDFVDSSSRPFTPAEAKQLILASTTPFQKFFKEQSYDRMYFSGDMVGWIRINQPYTNPFNECSLVDGRDGGGYPEVGNYLKNNNIDITKYDRFVYLVHHESQHAGCSSVGKYDVTVNGITHRTSQAWIGMTTAFTKPSEWGAQPFPWRNIDFLLGHELGHSLGLQHASSLMCYTSAEDCEHEEYGNYYDTMGSRSFSLHFNGLYKELLGWLKPQDILHITSTGRYNLSPLELASSGKKLAKVYTLDQSKIPFYLEFRRGIGFDSNLNSTSLRDNQNGLMVNFLEKNSLKTKLIDTTYNKPVEDSSTHVALTAADTDGHKNLGRGIVIGPVIAASSTGISFYARIETPQCVRMQPIINNVSETGYFFAGKVNNMNISFQNQDSLSCGASQFQIIPRVPTGWVATIDPVTSVSVDPLDANGIGNKTILFTPPASALEGEYVISFDIVNLGSGKKITRTFYKSLIVPPSITSISPTSALPGTIVTVNGAGFKEPSKVSLTNTSTDIEIPAIIGSAGRLTFVIPPQTAADTYNVRVNSNYVLSENKNMLLEVRGSTTKATAALNGNPTLRLEYDNNNKESALVATFPIKFTAGSSDITIPVDKAEVQVTSTGGSQLQTAKLYTNPQNLIQDLSAYTIKAGQTATFNIEARSIDLAAQFGGSYAAQLNRIYLDRNSQRYIELLSNLTNRVTIIGEKSPYINSVTNPVEIGQMLTVSGVRFASQGNILSLMKRDTGAITNFTLGAGFLNGIYSMSLRIPSTLTPGVYNLQLTHPTTGKSNNATLEINSASGLIITATAGANGTISPIGEAGVPRNGSQTYTFRPNVGYAVADVKVNNISIGKPASYTFSNVGSNQTIHVTFALAPTPSSQPTPSPTSQPATNATVLPPSRTFFDILKGILGF